MAGQNKTSDADSESSGGFRTTHWSVVLAAGHPEWPQAEKALATLCQIYWQPVYCFIRRRGHEAEQAKDLTQGFFARLIEKEYLRAADREKGRFRSFLLSCVQHFLNHEHDKEHALKRGGQYTFVSLDASLAEHQYAAEPVEELTPEMLYERRWALTLIDQALAQLRQQYADAGKEYEFAVLHVFLCGAKEAAETHATVATRLGMSEAAVRKAAQRMRGRFCELLRLQVAQTVAQPAEIEDELKHLRAVLSR